MNINDVLDTLMQFYPWLSKQSGLESWQLLSIALVVLFLLILFLVYQQKTRVKRIHSIQSTDRPDIIGINLTGRDNSSHTHDRKKEEVAFPDVEEEQQSWGQSTKEWRQLTEKIRHLQHEISKYERSEKYLKEQITELKNAKENLLSENSRIKHIEKELKQQINEMTNATFAIRQDKNVEDTITPEVQEQSKRVSPSSESLTLSHLQEDRVDSLQKTLQKHDVHIAAAEDHQKNQEKSFQLKQDMEHIPDETAANETQSQIAGNTDEIPEDTTKQNFDQSETTERELGVPLDIKELKAIADLAKRLQARSQQHQNE